MPNCIRCKKETTGSALCPECTAAPLVNIEAPYAIPPAAGVTIKPHGAGAFIVLDSNGEESLLTVDHTQALLRADRLRAMGGTWKSTEELADLLRSILRAIAPAVKRRVWWLSIDVHNAGGGDAELYGSEQEFNARLRQIIEEGIEEEGGTGEACEMAQAALDAGNIERAWAVFLNGPDEMDECEGLRHPDDYYYYGEQDVEFPAEKGGAL